MTNILLVCLSWIRFLVTFPDFRGDTGSLVEKFHILSGPMALFDC